MENESINNDDVFILVFQFYGRLWNLYTIVFKLYLIHIFINEH